MQATRERKMRFIKDFGCMAPRDAVLRLFTLYGLEMLPDDLLDEAASHLATEWRRRERMHRQNRAMTKARAAAD